MVVGVEIRIDERFDARPLLNWNIRKNPIMDFG
jgi:hypothetical protein